MDYSFLKHSHAGLAYLTILLFVARFLLFSVAPKWRANKLFKILPHVIDTALILLAIMLCLQLGQYPFTSLWLTAKLLGLIAYIVFATIAIKRASRSAFVYALISFAYMLGVAKFKSVLSWIAPLLN